MRVLIDGVAVPEEDAAVSVLDWGLQRGFGCFEVIRAYGGVPFRLRDHAERLARSAAALHIEPPARRDLEAWVTEVAAAGGDCLIRVLLTGGGRDELVDVPSRTVVLWEPVPEVPSPLRLLPITAAWHPARSVGGFSGVKWLSYAPNMASSDAAHRAGFDDALLLTPERIVLEGPTYTVAWLAGGALETPTLELGILASITRDVLLEAAERLTLTVVQGRFPLDRLLGADEVLALSTVKEVTPVGEVGEHRVATGPVAGKLAEVFRDIVRAET